MNICSDLCSGLPAASPRPRAQMAALTLHRADTVVQTPVRKWVDQASLSACRGTKPKPVRELAAMMSRAAMAKLCTGNSSRERRQSGVETRQRATGTQDSPVGADDRGRGMPLCQPPGQSRYGPRQAYHAGTPLDLLPLAIGGLDGRHDQEATGRRDVVDSRSHRVENGVRAEGSDRSVPEHATVDERG